MKDEKEIMKDIDEAVDEKPDYEIIGKFVSGRVRATKWKSANGISYSLQIGYQKDNEWKNKRISILESEMPIVINALDEISSIPAK